MVKNGQHMKMWGENQFLKARQFTSVIVVKRSIPNREDVTGAMLFLLRKFAQNNLPVWTLGQRTMFLTVHGQRRTAERPSVLGYGHG